MYKSRPDRTTRTVTTLAAALLVAGASVGCAASAQSRHARQRSLPMSALTGETPRPPNRWQGAHPAPTPAARELLIFDGATGSPLSWDELLRRASDSTVVLLGEVHAHPVGLDAAATLFEDLLARSRESGAKPALSLEFLERDHQPALDDYLSGVTDEEGFRAATGRKDSNFPPAHQRMVRAAKAAGRPVAAANAPRRYVRLARTEGFEKLASLAESQRRLFVIPASLTEGRYRDDLLKMMRDMPDHAAPARPPGNKAPSPAAADPSSPAGNEPDPDDKAMGYFRSQNVWDATMADSITRLVSEGSRPVVHVVGQFHCDYDGGLTRRVREALPGAPILTVSFVAEPPPEAGPREEDRGRASIVVYTGSGPAE